MFIYFIIFLFEIEYFLKITCSKFNSNLLQQFKKFIYNNLNNGRLNIHNYVLNYTETYFIKSRYLIISQIFSKTFYTEKCLKFICTFITLIKSLSVIN